MLAIYLNKVPAFAHRRNMNMNSYDYIFLPSSNCKPNKYLYMKITTKQRSYCSHIFFLNEKKTWWENNMQYSIAKIGRKRRTLLEYYYSNYVFMASLSDLYETFIVRYSPIPYIFWLRLFVLTSPTKIYRKRGFWCANAIKMAEKNRILYRHDLLLLD